MGGHRTRVTKKSWHEAKEQKKQQLKKKKEEEENREEEGENLPGTQIPAESVPEVDTVMVEVAEPPGVTQGPEQTSAEGSRVEGSPGPAGRGRDRARRAMDRRELAKGAAASPRKDPRRSARIAGQREGASGMGVKAEKASRPDPLRTTGARVKRRPSGRSRKVVKNEEEEELASVVGGDGEDPAEAPHSVGDMFEGQSTLGEANVEVGGELPGMAQEAVRQDPAEALQSDEDMYEDMFRGETAGEGGERLRYEGMFRVIFHDYILYFVFT